MSRDDDAACVRRRIRQTVSAWKSLSWSMDRVFYFHSKTDTQNTKGAKRRYFTKADLFRLN